MSKTDEYRQFANDCVVWARIATSDDQREQFLELAKEWMSDAESVEHRRSHPDDVDQLAP